MKEINDDMKKALLQQVNELKQGVKNYKQKKSMGLGKLGEPTINFVRKFRWTLKGKGLPEHFVTKVNFDFCARTIEMECMEMVHPEDDDVILHKWLDSELHNEELVFTTYDGCGTPLYEYKLSGLYVTEDTCSFDYASSDVSTRKLKLSFDKFTRTFLAKGDPRIPKKKFYSWTVNVGDPNDPLDYDVKVAMRPMLNVEETEISLLNAKAWIPGKSNWEPITLTADRRTMRALVSGLFSREEPQIELKMWLGNKVRLLETWTLNNVKFDKSKNLENGKFEIEVKYDNVKYRSEATNENTREGQDQSERKGEVQSAAQVTEAE